MHDTVAHSPIFSHLNLPSMMLSTDRQLTDAFLIPFA
jgi:hypothetical protein